MTAHGLWTSIRNSVANTMHPNLILLSDGQRNLAWQLAEEVIKREQETGKPIEALYEYLRGKIGHHVTRPKVASRLNMGVKTKVAPSKNPNVHHGKHSKTTHGSHSKTTHASFSDDDEKLFDLQCSMKFNAIWPAFHGLVIAGRQEIKLNLRYEKVIHGAVRAILAHKKQFKVHPTDSEIEKFIRQLLRKHHNAMLAHDDELIERLMHAVFDEYARKD